MENYRKYKDKGEKLNAGVLDYHTINLNFVFGFFFLKKNNLFRL